MQQSFTHTLRIADDRPLDLLGVGVGTLDILTVVPSFPTGRVTSPSSACIRCGGGPVATALATAATLGLNTRFVDRVGDDWIGGYILDEFKKYNVATNESVTIIPGARSSLSTILVESQNGARASFFCTGNTKEYESVSSYEQYIPKAKVVHINGRHISSLNDLISIAHHTQTLISFDGGAQRHSESSEKIAAQTDVCIVAQDYAAHVTGESNPDTMCAKMLTFGPEIVGVTAGAMGSYIGCKSTGLRFHQQSFVSDRVVDTTGCGDSYHGAFLYALIRGYSLRSCAAIASAVAGINASALGGRGCLPTEEQVLKFLNERGVLLE